MSNLLSDEYLKKTGLAQFTAFVFAFSLLVALVSGNLTGWALNFSCGLSVTAVCSHRWVRGWLLCRSPRRADKSKSRTE